MQELNRQMMALPELRELEEIIRFGTGPAAVSGVSGVHRAMLGAALRQETKRPLAVLCADEQEARRMAADLAALTGEECVTLFAREWQLRDRVSASHSFEQERLDALCRMAFGRTVSSSRFFVRRCVATSNSPIASISVSKNSTRTGALIGE